MNSYLNREIEKEVKTNTFLEEKIYKYKLQNGLKCYIIPKEDYVNIEALVVFNYGSINSTFMENGHIVETPRGVAHFLEHKMFDYENGNLFQKFSENSASVNAYTNYTSTAYYFNCTTNFNSNLKLLIDMVQTPYFSTESIEKEKGIISQEIKMYEDSPFWRTFINMQKSMYTTNPVRNDIAGSISDISTIDKACLDLCYKKFYNENNMAIICVGDINVIKTIEFISNQFNNNSLNIKEENHNIPYDNSKDLIKANYIACKMNINSTMFHIGFRDYDFTTDLSKKIASSKLAMDILTGESTDWYQNLYNQNIIDSSFSRDYTCGTNFTDNKGFTYGATVFTGYADNPKKVFQHIINQADFINKNGIDDLVFNRTKKKYLGRLIRSFNNIDTIVMGQADFHIKNMDIFDLINAYDKIDKHTVEKRIKEHYKEEFSVISVATPHNK